MRNATALIAATLVGSTFAGAGAFAESPKSPGEQASLDSRITRTVKAELSAQRARTQAVGNLVLGIADAAEFASIMPARIPP